jgi:hypothetical protein
MSSKILATSAFFSKNCPKKRMGKNSPKSAKIRPNRRKFAQIGENSPNLVTLLTVVAFHNEASNRSE